MERQIEANMTMCVNKKTGRKKPFPKNSIMRGNLLGTDWKVDNEPSVPYVKKASTALDNKGKVEVDEKGREDFKNFINAQKDAKVLEQSKERFTADWQTKLIDEKIQLL